MLIVADEQILCGSCGALLGLAKYFRGERQNLPTIVLKDQYVVSNGQISPAWFCNSTCKERAPMTSEEIKQEIESLRTESKRALEARAPEIARSYLSEVPLWEIAFQLAARNERPTADREEIRTLWSSDQETGRVWREHAGHLQNELNQARESVRLAVQLKLKAQGELDAANQHVKILQESERRGGPLTVCFDNLTSALRVVLGAYSVDELTRCLDRNHEEFRAILAQAEALRSARA